MKSRGESTQPYGEPVEVCRSSDNVLLTRTLCDLLAKKFNNHLLSRLSRWKWQVSLLARMWGCSVLNAEEKSAIRSLADVFGHSRCLCIVSMKNTLALSTPLPAR